MKTHFRKSTQSTRHRKGKCAGIRRRRNWMESCKAKAKSALKWVTLCVISTIIAAIVLSQAQAVPLPYDWPPQESASLNTEIRLESHAAIGIQLNYAAGDPTQEAGGPATLGQAQEVVMDSSFIGKIDKARRYAEEKERVSIQRFSATFHGNHNSYAVEFDSGVWRCECAYFLNRGVCSHTMALQRMLDEMLARSREPVAAD